MYEESVILLSEVLETGRKKPRVGADFLCSNEHSLARRRNCEDEYFLMKNKCYKYLIWEDDVGHAASIGLLGMKQNIYLREDLPEELKQRFNHSMKPFEAQNIPYLFVH